METKPKLKIYKKNGVRPILNFGKICLNQLKNVLLSSSILKKKLLIFANMLFKIWQENNKQEMHLIFLKIG